MKCEDQRIKQKPSHISIAIARIYLTPSRILSRLLLAWPLCEVTVRVVRYKGIDRLIAASKWD
jgi:hypothetical protein